MEKQKTINAPKIILVIIITLLFVTLFGLIFLAKNKSSNTLEEKNVKILDVEEIKNFEYSFGSGDKKYKLTDGSYVETFSDTASENYVGIFDERIVFGDFDNDGKNDAVVILDSSSGGTGHFYELTIVLDRNGEPFQIASENLGDRTIFNSLEIKDGKIIIDMIMHGPRDEGCCPTLRKVFEYELKENKLVKISEKELPNIASWQTYRNEEYGFELQYPEDWKTSNYSSGLLVLENVKEEIYFAINIKKNYNLDPNTSDVEMEKIDIGDHLGYKYFYQEGVGNSEVVLIQLNQDVLQLSLDYFANNNGNINDRKNAIQEIINPILSTFRFIEKDKEIFSCGDSIIEDVDGNIYNTVKIGEQCWMKENLKVTKNPEGEKIVRYCLNDNASSCNNDGGLYDWNTAMDGLMKEGAQGICPNGWHIPEDLEWFVLENYLKDEGQACSQNRTGWGCGSAGTKIRINGSSGFDAPFAGYRDIDKYGTIHSWGRYAGFWSSSVYRDKTWYRFIRSDESRILRIAANREYGRSIRCLKD